MTVLDPSAPNHLQPNTPPRLQRRAGMTPGERAAIGARALAAIFGGYGVAYVWTTALAALLPLRPVEAVVTGTLTGLVVYPCAAMWSFAARSALRAWTGLALSALAPGLLLLALHGMGGQA